MKNFEFNEDDIITTNRNFSSKRTNQGFTKYLIKWGLAKNENQATLYLVAFFIINFVIIIYLNIDTPDTQTHDPLEKNYVAD